MVLNLPFRAAINLCLAMNTLRTEDSYTCLEQYDEELEKPRKRMVVFSGGTAFNSVAHELQQGVTASVAHVLPVSDDGGSTAEIVRVLGGPAVGDIRSRCLRLSDDSTTEARATKSLLGHRLISAKTAPEGMTREEIRRQAREEWLAIVEGDQDATTLWSGISTAYKDTIRAFLVHFHLSVIRHATWNAREKFDFTGGSVGNFFFAGARIFFGSMSAAIFLYSRVSGIPKESDVLPSVITEERLTLGALLEDGTRIRGQHNISHPSKQVNDIHMAVDKRGGELCSSPIKEVQYLYHDKNQPTDWWDDKHVVYPETNPLVIDALKNAGSIIFGMGSLYTSILPTLILNGVAENIASSSCPKLLLLNGWHDRETSWRVGDGEVKAMDATMYVKAIVEALSKCYERSEKCRRDCNNSEKCLRVPTVTDFITHILYPRGGEFAIDRESLQRFTCSRATLEDQPDNQEQRSIQIIEVDSIPADTNVEDNLSGGKSHHRVYEPKALVRTLRKLTAAEIDGIEF